MQPVRMNTFFFFGGGQASCHPHPLTPKTPSPSADSGPNGFYDNLGVAGQQPNLVPGPGFATDPSFKASALSGFQVG